MRYPPRFPLFSPQRQMPDVASSRRGARREQEAGTMRRTNRMSRDLATMVDGDDDDRNETDTKVMMITMMMRMMMMVVMAMLTTMMMTMMMTTTMMMVMRMIRW